MSMPTKEMVLARRDEYITWLEPRIKTADEKFRKLAMTEVARYNKPLRTAEGRNQARQMTREWMWGDAIWCGDIHLEHFADFIGTEDLSDDDFQSLIEEIPDFLEETWNIVFKKLCPDMYWRHIAPDAGDEPTNDMERYWMEHDR